MLWRLGSEVRASAWQRGGAAGRHCHTKCCVAETHREATTRAEAAGRHPGAPGNRSAKDLQRRGHRHFPWRFIGGCLHPSLPCSPLSLPLQHAKRPGCPQPRFRHHHPAQQPRKALRRRPRSAEGQRHTWHPPARLELRPRLRSQLQTFWWSLLAPIGAHQRTTTPPERKWHCWQALLKSCLEPQHHRRAPYGPGLSRSGGQQPPEQPPSTEGGSQPSRLLQLCPSLRHT